jgi:hypothetical protein
MALTDKAIKELTNYIEREGLEWAKQFIAGRKSWMDAKGIKATGALVQSLQEQVTATLEEAARVRIDIAFEPHGRYVEMKNLHAPAGGSDYIQDLEGWIERKGFRSKWTNRFMANRALRTVPTDVLTRLAWSVAVSRRQRVKRRRQWYNKPKQAAVTDLYNQIAAGLPDLVAEEIKNAFNNGSKTG